MAYEPRAVASLKKQEIIEEYQRLLEEFHKEAAARQEAERRAGETERSKDREALDEGLSATVGSVLEGLSRLRALVGSTLSELGDTMTEQAEKAEKLNRAIRLQEDRLKELRDIDVAADTMAKLAAAYDEELRRLQQAHDETMEQLEAEARHKRAALDQDIEESRARWEREQQETQRSRQQEEEEYRYSRDRARRQEEQEHEEKLAALERQLKQMQQTAEEEIARRKSEIAAREEELEQRMAEIEAFPQRLEEAVQRARDEVRAEMERQAEHERALAQVERDWERKSFEQTISHLENVNRGLEKKVQELAQDLRETRKQLNSIAERAVEGVSLAKAFGEHPRRADSPANE